MVITQTPLRISFFGGGTDLAGFYRLEEGCVLSTTINKYIYVILKDRFDDKVRVGYTKTELVDDINLLEHELVREALRMTGLTRRVELATMADIPSAGSGLGSSSAVTVGVLQAIYAHQNEIRDAGTLARQACEIEIDALGKPIGKQDQFSAAFGGLRYIRFLPDETVLTECIDLNEEQQRCLSEHLMLFYTNQARKSESILVEQRANIADRMDTLRQLKEFAAEGRNLLQQGAFVEFGRLLHESWQHKKRLASKISNETIDALYDTARQAGATGGKITGAGGGGFMLLWVPPERRDRVRQALAPLPELPIRPEPGGSKVIFNYVHS